MDMLNVASAGIYTKLQLIVNLKRNACKNSMYGPNMRWWMMKEFVWQMWTSLFTARHKVLYMLWHIHQSVCLSVCQSVTLGYCVKTRECRTMWSSLSDSPLSLVFWCQEWLMGDDPVQVRSTPCENSRAVHISPHNSGNVIDIENSSINVNIKSTMGVSTSHQPRSCVTHNFLKMRFKIPKFVVFPINFRQKSIKSLLQSFIV